MTRCRSIEVVVVRTKRTRVRATIESGNDTLERVTLKICIPLLKKFGISQKNVRLGLNSL